MKQRKIDFLEPKFLGEIIDQNKYQTQCCAGIWPWSMVYDMRAWSEHFPERTVLAEILNSAFFKAGVYIYAS